MHGQKDAAFQALGLAGGRSFERLAMGAEPNSENAVAADPLIDTAGDRFHLRKLGHGPYCRRTTQVQAGAGGSAHVPGEWRFFFGCMGLGAAPFLEVDEPQYEADTEHRHGGVFQKV